MLGLLAAEGEAATAVVGAGVPDELAGHVHGKVLGDGALVAAGKVAQERRNGPVIILGAGAETALQAVLDEPEIERARLLLLGTGNALERAALEAVPWLTWPRVRYVDLEYVPPRVIEETPGAERLEGGLGLVVLDADAEAWSAPRPRFVPIARLLPRLRSAWLPPRIAAEELQAAYGRADATIAAITSSASWRITAPLRAAKRVLRRR